MRNERSEEKLILNLVRIFCQLDCIACSTRCNAPAKKL